MNLPASRTPVLVAGIVIGVGVGRLVQMRFVEEQPSGDSHLVSLVLLPKGRGRPIFLTEVLVDQPPDRSHFGDDR